MIQIDPESLNTLPLEPALSKAALTRFLNRARKLVELHGEVEVLMTSDAELKRLNRAFRKKNKATDILSFPAPPEISEQHAGDLAISLETSARQAAEYGHTLFDELRILMLHGLLHLAGLDHETDAGEMAARESDLRAALKLPTSLIARVAVPRKMVAPMAEQNAPLRAKKSQSSSHGKVAGSAEPQPLPVAASRKKELGKTPAKTSGKAGSR